MGVVKIPLQTLLATFISSTDGMIDALIALDPDAVKFLAVTSPALNQVLTSMMRESDKWRPLITGDKPKYTLPIPPPA